MFKSILERTTPPTPSKLEDMLYILFVYLGMIESVGNSIVDIIVMLLVANGRDFHIECRGYRTPRIKHVVSLKEDLEKERIPLGTKLSFLRENDIKELASIIDSDLRNAIAHLNFDVKQNEIYVRGQPATAKVVVALRKLRTAINTVEKLLSHLAKERGLTPKQER